MEITLFRDGASHGPYTIETLQSYLRSGEVTGNDLAWMAGMADWKPLSSFTEIFPVPPPPPSQILSSSSGGAKGSNLQRSWLCYAICLSTFALAYVLDHALVYLSQSGQQSAFGDILITLCTLTAFVTFAGTGVFFNLLLYKSWKRLAGYQPTISPGLAIGLMFVPFFNLYWQFRAFYGLSNFTNRIAQAHGSARRAFSGVALSACILACLLIIPGFNLLLLLPLAIVSIISWKSIVDTLDEVTS